jgi:alpha-galactosidase/6-phospho-beta-glucosidase family protein
MCAVRIAPVLLGIARRMEAICPDAWLVNFVNPVAVISGMINNHTKIKSMGVCAGFVNHLWDISRIFGCDEEAKDLSVRTAGVNHLSFITHGTWQNRDLFEMLDAHLSKAWEPPVLQSRWNDTAKQSIQYSVSRLVRYWRELGALVFSTEGDGLDHLMYDEAVRMRLEQHVDVSEAGVVERMKARQASRDEADQSFTKWSQQDLDGSFWDPAVNPDSRFWRKDQDIFVRIFTALSGVVESEVAVSVPNRGAIEGIKDRHVVEYTQHLSTAGLVSACPDGKYVIPDVVHGLVSGLATHQTMLGDALATEDPVLLAKAMLAYPVKSYTQDARALFRDLFDIWDADLLPAYRLAKNHF